MNIKNIAIDEEICNLVAKPSKRYHRGDKAINTVLDAKKKQAIYRLKYKFNGPKWKPNAV